MKRFLLFLFSATLFSSVLFAQKSDTIHVQNYEIRIDSIDYSKSTIKGKTTVLFESKVSGLSKVRLDLLNMTVQRVESNGTTLQHSYDGKTLIVTLPAMLALGDIYGFTVEYSGKPFVDGTFGGFYFSGNYAFNIGVGFDADPHNLGKAWFPCVDEFTDRSTYEFYITTAPGYKAFCNGLLMGSVLEPDGRTTWHWSHFQPIATYLASVAVAPYVELKRTYKGIPISLACVPADTNNVKKTMAKLDTAIRAYCDAWGTYPFSKIGYVLVPFNGGAMEHASSIHVGRLFINGTLTYETLWAHELSHMWFGDRVTCKTADDMWLNEGWASYNEAFFLEAAYGKTAYKDWMRTKHRSVLQFTYLKDDGYRPMNVIPHDYTYGSTVYDKGAVIAHTIRGFLGDTRFFSGMQNYLNVYGFNNATSANLRDVLSSATGVSMNQFFTDWVFSPGFPHFYIRDYSSVVSGGGYVLTLKTGQNTKGNAGHLYKTPMEFYVAGANKDTTITCLLDSVNNTFHCALPFEPKWVTMDKEEKISDAITDETRAISAAGTYVFKETNATVVVNSAPTGSNQMRVEYHWVGPVYSTKPVDVVVSPEHYWTISGLFSAGFPSSKITFNYDGATPVSYNSGWLDNELIQASESFLVLLYRANGEALWQKESTAAFNHGSLTDKRGSVTADLKAGEYALGILRPDAAVNDTEGNSKMLKVYPIPASRSLNIDVEADAEAYLLKLYSADGKELRTIELRRGMQHLQWDMSTYSAGTYMVKLLGTNNKVKAIKKVIVN